MRGSSFTPVPEPIPCLNGSSLLRSPRCGRNHRLSRWRPRHPGPDAGAAGAGRIGQCAGGPAGHPPGRKSYVRRDGRALPPGGDRLRRYRRPRPTPHRGPTCPGRPGHPLPSAHRGVAPAQPHPGRGRLRPRIVHETHRPQVDGSANHALAPEKDQRYAPWLSALIARHAHAVGCTVETREHEMADPRASGPQSVTSDLSAAPASRSSTSRRTSPPAWVA